MDDAALVARVAAGDAEALGVLYDRYGADAYRFARALVGGSANEADDVTAAAFAQLWHTAATYDRRRGSVAAWVTMATRARALDHVRARRLQAEGRADAVAAPVFEFPPDGSAEPPDRALELAFFGGLSPADVAEALGESPGTVKTRIRAGLLKLREALRPLAARGGG